MTPGLYVRAVRGAEARLERESLMAKAQAWHVENFARHKRLPSLDKVLKVAKPAAPRPDRKASPEEIQAVLRGVNRRPEPPSRLRRPADRRSP